LVAVADTCVGAACDGDGSCAIAMGSLIAEVVVPDFSDAPLVRNGGCAEVTDFVVACGLLPDLWDAGSPCL
jgi:hypothetical protein